ncbi:MAG: RNA polymerase sigma factor [Planctomycetota bacterium]
MADYLDKNTAETEKLVNEALGGDVSAFGAVVERHWNMVVALAMAKVADTAEAEDVAQESFLKAFCHLHTLKDKSRFAGWIARITMQECTNSARRGIRSKKALGSRAGEYEILDAMPAGSCNPGLSGWQIRFIRKRVRQLPEKFRKVIIMRFVSGFSSVQIARQLGKRPGTVRVWLHRAYNILRKDLAPVIEEVKS